MVGKCEPQSKEKSVNRNQPQDDSQVDIHGQIILNCYYKYVQIIKGKDSHN